jgi:outer membrane protein OmpA-like peptidoglycan-associated protein
MKQLLFIVMLTLLLAPACANKKYVAKEVGVVNEKVESLSQSVEENQERIKSAEAELDRHSGEIGRVDAKADEAGSLANSAKDDAASAMRAAQGKLIYEVTLSNDVSFDFGAAKLSEDAKTQITELAEKVKADNRRLYIEIEGHTDNTGDESYNERLGLKRAEAVRDYLYQTNGIPLHAISVFSFGESQPIGDNANREGRAQNRRVVIKVLE